MTQEDKELLLKDLCGRLPYGVIIKHKDEHGKSIDTKLVGYNGDWFNYYIDNLCFHLKIHEFKPYLRPMLSMTEEENKELFSIWTGSIRGDMIAKFDFYIKHHFDFRLTSEGLSMIEAGLALEAPKDMYK